jgi:hypothetical protein
MPMENYVFTGLANGSYTVTPRKTGHSFSPVSLPITIIGLNQSGVNFTAQATTWSISGRVSPSANGSGTTVILSGSSLYGQVPQESRCPSHLQWPSSETM